MRSWSLCLALHMQPDSCSSTCICGFKQQREKWQWQWSGLLPPELAHCAPLYRILFELSGAHAGQGRCLSDLHSPFPRAVYHCHSPNQTPPLSQLSSKIQQICLRRSCLWQHIAPSFSRRSSPTWLSRAPHHLCCSSVASCCSPVPLTISLRVLSPSVSTDKSLLFFPFAPLHDTFAVNLFCLGFLSPCLSFPLIHSGAVWKWFWRFSCSVQLPIGDILHSLTFYYEGNTIIACEGEIFNRRLQKGFFHL